jgi:histo-blood group ABO system transferase
MNNKKYRIGMLVIATGKYNQFVPPLFKSIKKHFLKNHDVTMFVFSDKEMPKKDGLIHIYQEHQGWPNATLLRYHVFYNNKNVLKGMDYLYYCDADMLFIDDVSDEILGELVGTIHPGYYNTQRGTYETNEKSTAFVSKNENGNYYAGGFNGGTFVNFLKMSEIIKNNIDIDIKNNITAIWHDESHLNRYFIDNPPTVKLSPSYCYPEQWEIPFDKKLLALNKKHSELRNIL